MRRETSVCWLCETREAKDRVAGDAVWATLAMVRRIAAQREEVSQAMRDERRTGSQRTQVMSLSGRKEDNEKEQESATAGSERTASRTEAASGGCAHDSQDTHRVRSSQRLECSDAQIEAARIVTWTQLVVSICAFRRKMQGNSPSRARVGDLGRDRLAGVGAGDLDALAAVRAVGVCPGPARMEK